MSGRGNPILAAWQERLIAEREAVVVTTKCEHCSWSTYGPMSEGRVLYAAHRTEKHPELGPPPLRRKRKRPFGGLVTDKSLDENIAGARAQGAAEWAGTE